MTKKYVYDDTMPGRPPIETTMEPPKAFAHHDELMHSLDARGWYREISTRLRRSDIAAHYDSDELEEAKRSGFTPVSDPTEMDRLMCRGEPVAVVRNETDLKIAQYNERLVVEIDIGAHDDVIMRSLKVVIDGSRAQPPRRKRFNVWSEHRILALLDLKLWGYDFGKKRKQLALWLFPEIEDGEDRGRKFDRARGYLDDAIASIASLRAYRE